MDMKKISAACATAAALAALCVPGAAFAADGTLTLNAGDGSTLAGHSFTVYKLANYNDVVKDGANVKSVSASSPDAAADAWVKAALRKGRYSFYQPAVSKEDFWKATVQENARFFDKGDMAAFACHLCEDALTKEEVQVLKKKLDELN